MHVIFVSFFRFYLKLSIFCVPKIKKQQSAKIDAVKTTIFSIQSRFLFVNVNQMY